MDTVGDEKVKEWQEMLRRDGYRDTYAQEDPAGLAYPPHTHPVKTAHVIIAGGMTLTVEGRTRHLKAGDRCDVPAHALHEAKIGPAGCTYIIGE